MNEQALYNKFKEVQGCLGSSATKSNKARRKFSSEVDVDDYIGPISGEYILDVYKIQHSKAIRRLATKTQVFPDPKTNRHVRTRLIHTIEVASIAGVIAETLGLNTSLAQASAYGHDIGHAPFGHIGEEFISSVTGKKFRHEIFACVIAQHIERETRGLNLTMQTLQGIAAHSRGKGTMTTSQVSPEADVVMYADKIAYCFSDVSDIFKRGYLKIEDYPDVQELIEWFGPYQRIRTGRCVAALCVETAEKGYVSFAESEEAQKFALLKKAMYTVYPKLNRHRILPSMLENAYELIKEKVAEVDPAVLLALMTDYEVVTLYQTEIRDVVHILSTFSVSEIIPFISNRQIDFTDPDLNW